MTGLTLAAAGWRRRPTGPDTALFLGALTINMLLLSPICHLHYFSLCILVVMGLVAARWQRGTRQSLGVGLSLILLLNIVCYMAPNIPGWLILRALATTIYPTFIPWSP